MKIENRNLINEIAIELLGKPKSSFVAEDVEVMDDIIAISNIMYNNYPNNVLPLEDGVYDLLLELYKNFNPNYMVGAVPVIFKDKDIMVDEDAVAQITSPILYMDMEKTSDFIFKDNIMPYYWHGTLDVYQQNTDIYNDTNHRSLNTKHGYPELVGTLDKVKYVLNCQARDRGVFNDDNVKVFERDFLANHLNMGIINMQDPFEMDLELKYDGVSVEADVSDRIHSARSRGDTGEDLAMDITPILYGYVFPYAVGKVDPNEIFGMKFEAIMTKDNLQKYNQIRDKNYKNCRTAIISIFNSLDGYKFRDLITLVPLATSLNIDRQTEIGFMNQYYRSPVPLLHAFICGNYTEILYQVKTFVEEAEYLRSYMDFMYDGVVVSYMNDTIRKTLGRKNSVNLYSIAIKFNTVKKSTVFIGYDFTVGQDGTITPMIYYNPVEFFGTIHPKSSGHSYSRFMELGLRIGDIIDVEYTNDVMPYVYKPENSHNLSNPNPIVPFPTVCPCCGTSLVISASGKSAKCPNKNCTDRLVARAASTLKKLNLEGFDTASIMKIGKYRLYDFMGLTREDVAVLGDANSRKFIEQIRKLFDNQIYDYKFMGALGFEGIAEQKWKVILQNFTLPELITAYASSKDEFGLMLGSVKGIGRSTIDIIIEEWEYFLEDIVLIASLSNVVQIRGVKQTKVRITGFRDESLISILNDKGFDAGEGSVTKDTDVLLVPSHAHQSSKVANAIKYGIPIMTRDEFIQSYSIGI